MLPAMLVDMLAMGPLLCVAVRVARRRNPRQSISGSQRRCEPVHWVPSLGGPIRASMVCDSMKPPAANINWPRWRTFLHEDAELSGRTRNSGARRSAPDRALDAHIERIERVAGRHEQAIALEAAEAQIGGALGEGH